MLGSFRKFSNSITAKIFLFIVAIPFIFWGMGDLFSGGKQNTIATISKNKISTNEFINFINLNHNENDEINNDLIDKFLSSFIGEKLIYKEVEDFNIILTDSALSKIIKDQELFKKENKFSRTKYENFLITNNLVATTFEDNLSKEEKRRQFLDLIGGGIEPPNFLVNIDFNRINQKRNVELINLSEAYKKNEIISEDKINAFYLENKKKYLKVFKSFKFIKLNTKNLIGTSEYNDLFFKKIDEIDDLIIEGKNLKFILNKFKIENYKLLTFDKFGKDPKSTKINELPDSLIKKAFTLEKNDPLVLLEHQNDYFLLELEKTEEIQQNLTDSSLKKNIVSEMNRINKRKQIAQLISKIQNNSFGKTDFKNFSNEKNAAIKVVNIENQNDDKLLKKEIVNQIYTHPKNKVIVVADMNFDEVYLVYIDNIQNASINEKDEDFKKYFNLSRVKILNSVYNTYDIYLKNKYEIDINQNALTSIKNSFK